MMTSDDSMTPQVDSLEITTEEDIVTARTTIRETVNDLGFGLTDTTRIVTAVSELARNIILYADTGTMTWETTTIRGKTAIEIVFEDDGPGIQDVERAREEGYSTAQGMGHGLSGVQTLMDEFDIETSTDVGTTVIIRKYLP